MGYLYITIAVVLFSIQFLFTKKYQQAAGDSVKSAFLSNAVAPVGFVIIFFFLDGMKIQATPFALILAFISALVCNFCTYYSIKALALGSLTNYSLWLMSGGMLLPVLYGGIFENDAFGVAKIIGILMVCAAVIVKMDFKEKTDWKTLLCFIALFILNGLVGVISSIYQSQQITFEKVSSTQFSILSGLMRIAVGGIVFAFLTIKNKESEEEKTLHDYVKASPWAAIQGVCNGVANLLLLFALLTIEPSLQYPMVTGGCIFLSAIIGLFFKEKLSKRAWIAVALAMLGTIVMIF